TTNIHGGKGWPFFSEPRPAIMAAPVRPNHALDPQSDMAIPPAMPERDLVGQHYAPGACEGTPGQTEADPLIGRPGIGLGEPDEKAFEPADVAESIRLCTGQLRY